jgi:hypothetical protein
MKLRQIKGKFLNRYEVIRQKSEHQEQLIKRAAAELDLLEML